MADLHVKRLFSLFLTLLLGLSLLSGCGEKGAEEPRVRLAISWSNVPDSVSYTSTIVAAEETGAEVILLDMVRSADLSYDEEGRLLNAKDENGALSSAAAKLVKCNGWLDSNVEDVMKGIDCLIVPGGWDISPSLYYEEQEWHGIEADGDYSAERDVSDYLLLSYCLEKDIPVYCICRGMQMLSIVSGADLVQDIGKYCEEKGISYNGTHRDPEKKSFRAHDVKLVSRDSLLYEMSGKDVLKKCPSWHHQMVGDISGTRLELAATTDTDGIPVIEAVERRDRSFCLGVQYHPEVAVRKHVEGAEDKDDFMDYDTAMSGFLALVRQCA